MFTFMLFFFFFTFLQMESKTIPEVSEKQLEFFLTDKEIS